MVNRIVQQSPSPKDPVSVEYCYSIVK